MAQGTQGTLPKKRRYNIRLKRILSFFCIYL